MTVAFGAPGRAAVIAALVVATVGAERVLNSYLLRGTEVAAGRLAIGLTFLVGGAVVTVAAAITGRGRRPSVAERRPDA